MYDLYNELEQKIKEEWRDIPNYEGLYQASNLGRIKSLERIAKKEYNNDRIVKERIMNGTKNQDGYLKVHFKNKERNIDKGLFIHRLVASAFIPNPNNLPQIIHIDGNKLNNNVDNLEWCTNLYNQQHAWKNNLHKPTIHKGKKVKQYDLKGNFIKEYPSISNASKETRINISNIYSALNKKRKVAGGYIWIYSTK